MEIGRCMAFGGLLMRCGIVIWHRVAYKKLYGMEAKWCS